MSDRPPLAGTVLITGASSGIGRAIARRVCVEARRVILLARRVDRLQAVAEELRQIRVGIDVDVIQCDLTERKAIETVCDSLVADGGVDVLINNAGFGDRTPLHRASPDTLSSMVAVNVTAVVLMTQRLVVGMVERGHGGVLNIGSVLGHAVQPGVATYAGTKHFVAGFSSALRAELAASGVTVTEVCPGPVATEFGTIAGGRGGPAWMRIDADSCADQAIRGFRRGRAVVFPGRINRWIMRLLRWAPPPLLRWVLSRMGARAGGADVS